jgi:hypothetical protein
LIQGENEKKMLKKAKKVKRKEKRGKERKSYWAN